MKNKKNICEWCKGKGYFPEAALDKHEKKLKKIINAISDLAIGGRTETVIPGALMNQLSDIVTEWEDSRPMKDK